MIEDNYFSRRWMSTWFFITSSLYYVVLHWFEIKNEKKLGEDLQLCETTDSVCFIITHCKKLRNRRKNVHHFKGLMGSMNFLKNVVLWDLNPCCFWRRLSFAIFFIVWESLRFKSLYTITVKVNKRILFAWSQVSAIYLVNFTVHNWAYRFVTLSSKKIICPLGTTFEKYSDGSY